MATPNSKSIAILGAGITGLTAAHRVAQRGHRIRIFESSSRVGGAIRTERTDEWLIEAGPNSLLGGEPALVALLDDLGLASERISANSTARNRYILRRGRLNPVPLSPPALLTNPLFSVGAKLRVLAELATRPRVRTTDVSLEDFIRAHFGQEIVDYGLNPFIAGVYAGNPKKLSARYAFPKLWEIEQKHGSILRGQMQEARSRPRGEIFSFRHGLQTLPDALAARLPAGALSLHVRLEALVLSSTGAEPRRSLGEGPVPPVSSRSTALSPAAPWSVVWHDGVTTHTENFDAVIAALPAPALAQLRFGTLGERPLAALDGIEHPPVSSLFLGYRREHVAHPLDGFGLLIPEIEKRTALGVLFSSTLFPHRSPAGHVALTVMIGGTRQPALARLSSAEILSAVEPDLRQLLGATHPPVFLRHTFWPRAIPQYNLGYEQHLETMSAAERTYPRLFIGGQARDGISVPACIAAGEKLASRAARIE
ncbi:MAG: protoporphyrinogen oxidase [Opitutaceae bacterium]